MTASALRAQGGTGNRADTKSVKSSHPIMNRITSLGMIAMPIVMLLAVQLTPPHAASAASPEQRRPTSKLATPKARSLESILATPMVGVTMRVHRKVGIRDFAAWAPNPVVAANAFRAMSKRPGFANNLVVWTGPHGSAEIIEEVFSFPVAPDARTFIQGERRVLRGRHFPGARSSVETGVRDARRLTCRTDNVMGDFPIVFGVPAGVRKSVSVVTFSVGRSAVTLLFVIPVGTSGSHAKARHRDAIFSVKAMDAFTVHEAAVLGASRFGDSGYPTVESTVRKDRISVVILVIVGAAALAGLTSRRRRGRTGHPPGALHEPPYPANWYPDPSRSDGVRFWDGWAWTDERARRLDPAESADERTDDLSGIPLDAG